MMRIDRYLSEMGVASRSELKIAAKRKQITCNGELVKDPCMKIKEGVDVICFQGREIPYEPFVYYMLHKPAGVITATKDRNQTVMDLIEDKRDGLYPVGRLDVDTEGLLLITNDGPLGHDLLSPKKHVEKTYYAKVDQPIPADAKEKMASGMEFSDFTAEPALLEQINDTESYLTIHEGKYHQVKRMFGALGCQVTYLKRISMGPLRLDENLPAGSYRPLTKEEVEELQACTRR